jgi:hypothetical protein
MTFNKMYNNIPETSQKDLQFYFIQRIKKLNFWGARLEVVLFYLALMWVPQKM